MAKTEFLREMRDDYEGDSSADLELEIKDRLLFLMRVGLDADEFVHEDLRTLLALSLFYFEELTRTAIDGYQRKAYGALVEDYTAIFRNPEAVDTWMHVYCEDQMVYYIRSGEGDKAGRWKEIASAISRVIQGETELDKLIAVEVAARKDDSTFSVNEWRRWRKEGLEPDEISYNLCHVWVEAF